MAEKKPVADAGLVDDEPAITLADITTKHDEDLKTLHKLYNVDSAESEKNAEASKFQPIKNVTTYFNGYNHVLPNSAFIPTLLLALLTPFDKEGNAYGIHNTQVKVTSHKKFISDITGSHFSAVTRSESRKLRSMAASALDKMELDPTNSSKPTESTPSFGDYVLKVLPHLSVYKFLNPFKIADSILITSSFALSKAIDYVSFNNIGSRISDGNLVSRILKKTLLTPLLVASALISPFAYFEKSAFMQKIFHQGEKRDFQIAKEEEEKKFNKAKENFALTENANKELTSDRVKEIEQEQFNKRRNEYEEKLKKLTKIYNQDASYAPAHAEEKINPLTGFMSKLDSITVSTNKTKFSIGLLSNIFGNYTQEGNTGTPKVVMGSDVYSNEEIVLNEIKEYVQGQDKVRQKTLNDLTQLLPKDRDNKNNEPEKPYEPKQMPTSFGEFAGKITPNLSAIKLLNPFKLLNTALSVSILALRRGIELITFDTAPNIGIQTKNKPSNPFSAALKGLLLTPLIAINSLISPLANIEKFPIVQKTIQNRNRDSYKSEVAKLNSEYKDVVSKLEAKPNKTVEAPKGEAVGYTSKRSSTLNSYARLSESSDSISSTLSNRRSTSEQEKVDQRSAPGVIHESHHGLGNPTLENIATESITETAGPRKGPG